MSINLKPLSKYDLNYLKVIDLYKHAFPGAQHIPTWLLRYKLRNGKAGFSSIYTDDTWIGLIYITEYKDIIFIQFLAISESHHSGGYGSKVMDSMQDTYSGKRVVLNIEVLDSQIKNNPQRIRRKAFYEKNGFSSSGYIVLEPKEKLEMLIHGGSISKEEIEAIYKDLFGHFLSLFLRPKVIKISLTDKP